MFRCFAHALLVSRVLVLAASTSAVAQTSQMSTDGFIDNATIFVVDASHISGVPGVFSVFSSTLVQPT